MPKYIVVLEIESPNDPENWDWDSFAHNVVVECVCSKEIN